MRNGVVMGHIRLSRLKQKLGFDRKVIIYGAGDYAKNCYKILIESKITIEYFVVTKKSMYHNYFHGIPIYSFEEKIDDIKENGKMILIAIGEPIATEIKDTLNRNGLIDYLSIADFFRNFFDVENKEKSTEEWIDSLVEWCIDEKIFDMSNFHQIKDKLIEIINEKTKIRNRIVFLVGHMAPRVIKMAKSLCNNGYEVILLFYKKEILENPMYQDLKHISQYYFCQSIEELMYQILISQARIVHIFSNYNDKSTSIAYILIRSKSIFPLLVFEQYDIANGMYWTVGQEILEEEQYCLMNSDGICCRGFEIDYLINEKKFGIKGKIIKFFDYIGDEIYLSKNSNELSLCYAGHIVTEREYPDATYACMLEFAKLCETYQCHFHLYPTIWDTERYRDYVLMDKHNDYFHFHEPMPYEQLVKELSKYDYGVIPSRKNFQDRRMNGTFSENKMIYSAANKFFDILGAGLPIIAPFPIKIVNYFEEKGVLLNWTIEEYNFEELRKKKLELKKKVERFRREVQMKYRIQELIDFYNAL